MDSDGVVQLDGDNPITSPTSDTCIIRKTYTKASLESKFENNIYTIPIEFKVFSGSTFETGNTRKYANYGIFLKVYMLDSNEDRITVTTTPTSDYVKYTNARIYIEKVDPNKPEPEEP